MKPRHAVAALCASLLGIAFAKSASGAVGWDESRSVFMPSWRFGSTFHRDTLPGELTLCAPMGKSCTPHGTLVSGAFGRGPVLTNAFSTGPDVLAVGPVRLGAELSFGWGTGPSTRLATAQTISGQWSRFGGSAVVGLRFRSEAWAGFVELLPGLTELSAGVGGAPADRKALIASASALTLGARAGIGIIGNHWFSASAVVGAGFGLISDVNVGFRLELRNDAAKKYP